MEWDQGPEIRRDRRFQENYFQFDSILERVIMPVLLSFCAFFAVYAFNSFHEELKQIRQDLYSLQISFASLSRHVEDEDKIR